MLFCYNPLDNLIDRENMQIFLAIIGTNPTYKTVNKFLWDCKLKYCLQFRWNRSRNQSIMITRHRAANEAELVGLLEVLGELGDFLSLVMKLFNIIFPGSNPWIIVLYSILDFDRGAIFFLLIFLKTFIYFFQNTSKTSKSWRHPTKWHKRAKIFLYISPFLT